MSSFNWTDREFINLARTEVNRTCENARCYIDRVVHRTFEKARFYIDRVTSGERRPTVEYTHTDRSLCQQNIMYAVMNTAILLTALHSLFAIAWKASGAAGQARRLLKLKLKHRSDLDLDKLRLNRHEATLAQNIVGNFDISTSLSSIGGLRQEKEDILDIITLGCSAEARSRGLLPPKGILLSGPPGTGKTMLAKAVAKESGATFFNLRLSSLSNMMVGESEKNIAAVFSLAQKLAPSIVFFDEIDGFLRSRSSRDDQFQTGIKAEFMAQWDGLLSDRSRPVLVLAATNRPLDLDSAVLRRLPRQFNIGLPTFDDRLAILKIMVRSFKRDDTVDLPGVAALTEGFSGSDLDALCQAALSFPARSLAKQLRSTKQRTLQGSSGTSESTWWAPGRPTTAARELQMRSLSQSDFTTALTICVPTSKR